MSTEPFLTVSIDQYGCILCGAYVPEGEDLCPVCLKNMLWAKIDEPILAAK